MIKHFLWLCAVFLAGCAGGLGNQVGADVQGIGSNVVVEIDEKHAWLTLAQRQGADLVAEYETAASGLVREVLITSRRQGERGLAFTLPEGLRSLPKGPVCLYVQLRGNRSVLPVRRADGNRDTGRFRYAAWDEAARASSALRLQRNVAAAAQQRLDSFDRAIANRIESLGTRGWAQPAACETIGVTDATPTRAPLGVLPKDSHREAAKQACVNRALFTQQYRQQVIDMYLVAAKSRQEALQGLKEASSVAGMVRSGAELVLQMQTPSDPTAAAVLKARQAEARDLLADIRRIQPMLGRGFYPAFGKPDETMRLVSEAQTLHGKAILVEHAERIGLAPDKAPQLSANEQLGLVGAMLDAYVGCVADGQRELAVKLAAWDDLQRASPERNRRIREHYVAECRAQHAAMSQLRADRQQALRDREIQTMELARLESASRSVPPATTRVTLNELACP